LDLNVSAVKYPSSLLEGDILERRVSMYKYTIATDRNITHCNDCPFCNHRRTCVITGLTKVGGNEPNTVGCPLKKSFDLDLIRES